MSEGLRSLLEKLIEVGDQEIYNDDIRYRGRKTAMLALIGVCKRALTGERITRGKVEEAAAVARADARWPKD